MRSSPFGDAGALSSGPSARWSICIEPRSRGRVAVHSRATTQEVHFAEDRPDNRIYVGVPASAVAPGGTTASAATHLVVAVGSAISHSDDVPDEGFLTVGLD